VHREVETEHYDEARMERPGFLRRDDVVGADGSDKPIAHRIREVVRREPSIVNLEG
jgi:hypothetical protein